MKFNQILVLVLLSLLLGCSYGCNGKKQIEYEDDFYEELSPEEQPDDVIEEEYEEDTEEPIQDSFEEDADYYIRSKRLLEAEQSRPKRAVDPIEEGVEPEVPEAVEVYESPYDDEPMVGEESPEDYEHVEYVDEENYPDDF